MKVSSECMCDESSASPDYISWFAWEAPQDPPGVAGGSGQDKVCLDFSSEAAAPAAWIGLSCG